MSYTEEEQWSYITEMIKVKNYSNYFRKNSIQQNFSEIIDGCSNSTLTKLSQRTNTATRRFSESYESDDSENDRSFSPKVLVDPIYNPYKTKPTFPEASTKELNYETAESCRPFIQNTDRNCNPSNICDYKMNYENNHIVNQKQQASMPCPMQNCYGQRNCCGEKVNFLQNEIKPYWTSFPYYQNQNICNINRNNVHSNTEKLLDQSPINKNCSGYNLKNAIPCGSPMIYQYPVIYYANNPINPVLTSTCKSFDCQ